MNKLYFFLFFLIPAVSCSQEKQLNFLAKITNPVSDSLVISGRDFRHVIKADKGEFNDSFPIKMGGYELYDGKNHIDLWLMNPYDLTMEMNALNPIETLTFKGKGANENNFLAKRSRDINSMASQIKPGDDAAIDAAIDQLMATWEKDMQDERLNGMLRNSYKARSEYEKKHLRSIAGRELISSIIKDKSSPQFAFNDNAGKIVKLEDFKGKYVYIDVWATWCGPCRQQIPHLEKVHEKFKDKDIVFLSISVDKQKDHDKWKTLVDQEEMKGVQLIADKDFKSDFIKAYSIKSIPRFILIGPDGKVLDADAKRPSDPDLEKQLGHLLK